MLTVTSDANLDDLALVADKIMENINTGEVSTVGNASVPDLAGQLSRMTIELPGLRNEINKIRGRSRSRDDGWRNARSQNRGRSRGPGSAS